MKQSKFSKEEFEKTERKDVTMEDMEEMMGQVMSHDAKPDNSEYREPTILERIIPWRLRRKAAKAG